MHRSGNIFLFFLLFVLVGSTAGQESIRISGIVLDRESGRPMPYVNILVRGSFDGTTTDTDGRFQLTFKDTGRVMLEVSRIGYRDKKITVPVAAENDSLVIELEEHALYIPRIIVSASRREQDILESPVSVTVLSMRSVKERTIIDMEEALARETGITTINGQLNIRGSSGFAFGTGNRSLILIDDVPILGSAAGNMTWSMVPTSEIEQVEIVRSGGSTLYGSSAMGGVVNILTRMPATTPRTEIMVKNGVYSQPAYDQWKWRDEPGLFRTVQVAHSRQFGDHGGWIRFQERSSDGTSELDWEKSMNLTGKVKLNFDNGVSGSVYGNYYMDETGLPSQWKSPADPFEAPEMDLNNMISGNKTNINAFFNMALSPRQILKFKTSYLSSNWENTTAQKDYSFEKRIFGELQNTVNWTKIVQTITGLTVNYSTIDARIFGIHATNAASGYGLLQSRLTEKTTLLSGIRGEVYWVDGVMQDHAWAPQLALNHKPAEGLAFRVSYSKGFRVPSIAEMFASTQLNVFKVRPNPELKAETSESVETGMTFLFAGNRLMGYSSLDLAVFSTHYRRLIEPTPDNFGIIHFNNVTEARITGLEMTGLFNLLNDRLMLQMAYTWLDPVEIDHEGRTIDTLSYRFRHTLVSLARLDAGLVSFIIENRYSSRMDKVELFDENPATGQDKRVPVHVWDLGVNGKIAGVDVQFRINNVFQYYYTELERNMAPERAISLSFSKTF